MRTLSFVAPYRDWETQEEIVSKQASNNVKKLNAIATSEEVTELQRLVAQMKLAEIEMQKEFNPALTQQSQRFTELSARHAQLQKAYNITSQAIKYRDWETDRKSTRLNSSHSGEPRMPSSA